MQHTGINISANNFLRLIYS